MAGDDLADAGVCQPTAVHGVDVYLLDGNTLKGVILYVHAGIFLG